MVFHHRLAFRLLLPLIAVAALAIGLLLAWPLDPEAGSLALQAARVAAVALAVFVGLVYIILRILVLKPMRALLEWTNSTRERKLAAPIDVDAVGEIGALAAAFNEMMDARRETQRVDRKKTTELSSLSSIVERITRSIDLKTLQSIVSELLLESFEDVEVAGTVLRPTRGSRLQLSFRNRCVRTVEEHELSPDDVGTVPHLIEGDVLERWIAEDAVPADHDEACVHVVPLRGSEAGGGLIVARLLPGRSLGERERALLRTLAAHVSMAVENARLYALVITDELTQLYTVRFFQQTLAREIENYHRYGQKLCLLMLDLDDFKCVNDQHGHPTGDRVLQRVAETVRRCVREVDVVCRYGGEEFAVILPGTDGRAAAVVAERIRAQIDQARVDLNGDSLHTTISIGISACPDDATSVRDLVEHADRALYEAKQGGKNRVVAA